MERFTNSRVILACATYSPIFVVNFQFLDQSDCPLIPISFQFSFQFRSNSDLSTNQSAHSNFIFRTDAILVSRKTYSKYF